MQKAEIIQLPYKFVPRPYQIPFLKAMDEGKKRAVKVWHRKAGKEKTDWNFMIKEAHKRTGNYWYIFPKLTQARKVLWEGIDQDGVSFLDHIPKELLDGDPNKTSMMVKFKCGSTIQLIGGDCFDASSIGGNPIGVVFSEYSVTSPSLWSFVRPILANNGGWAVFNFTPRGENHAYDLFELAKNDPEHWFSELLTVEDTKAVPKDILEQERSEIIKLDGNDAMYQQEYNCSFSVPMSGAYYAEQINLAYKDGRVTGIPYDQALPVFTWWDLGRNDSNSIWFGQMVGGEIRFIDYEEGVGKSMIDWIKICKDKPYSYESHYAPHDINVHEYTTNKTRLEVAKNNGINFKIVPKTGINDGINAVRIVFNRCWFDKEKCRTGLNALKSYHKQFDDNKKCFLDHPYHDWSSNGADAFRMMAISINPNKTYLPPDQRPNRNVGGWNNGSFVPTSRYDRVR